MYFPEAQPIWLTHNVTPAPVPVPLQRKAS
jgi:hypothetical protein